MASLCFTFHMLLLLFSPSLCYGRQFLPFQTLTENKKGAPEKKASGVKVTTKNGGGVRPASLITGIVVSVVG